MDTSKTFGGSSARRNQLRVLLGTMIALVVADGIKSRFLIARGFAHEGNPFLQTWISHDVFLYLKLVGAFLAAVILWQVSRSFPRVSFYMAMFFVAGYKVLVLWSSMILFVSKV